MLPTFPTILLTAFEPFAGADCNPSERVVDVIAGSAFDGFRVVTATLPVVAADVPRRLLSLLGPRAPDAILSLGEARGAVRIRVERRAVNRLCFQTDNSGAPATDGPVVAGGPAEYPSTVPVDAIAVALASAGIDCKVFDSAGTYCCNQVLYHALHHSALYRPQRVAGFLHLPSLAGQCVNGVPVDFGMSLDLQVRAVQVALSVIAAESSKRSGQEVI